MEPTSNCAAKIKDQIAEINLEIKQILSDPVLMQWRAIDLEKNKDILESFRLNRKHIAEMQHKLKSELITPTKEITRLENNLGHLFVDIESNHIEEDKASQKCTHLQKETELLSKTINTVHQYLTYLQDAATSIRANMTIDKLTPLAEQVTTGKNTKYFHIGLSYLSLLDEKNGTDSTNLKHFLEEVERVEAKLIRLEFPELPKLAETILANHVNTCISNTQLIKQFIDKTKAAGAKQLKSLDNFTDILNAHSTDTLSTIFEALPDLIKKLSVIICDLHQQATIIAEVKRLESLIQAMNTTHVALKHDYLSHLSQQTSTTSPLAPSFTANQKAMLFFGGFSGIIRNFRLRFGGPSRGEEKPERYLANLLIKAIETCPYYYGSEISDITKITAFIDNLLIDCPRPFPYEDFFKIIKKTISTYGEHVERDFHRYKIYSDAAHYRNDETTGDKSNTSKTTFGRILSKVEARSEQLKNTMQQKN
jgi:hypothetical protein